MFSRHLKWNLTPNCLSREVVWDLYIPYTVDGPLITIYCFELNFLDENWQTLSLTVVRNLWRHFNDLMYFH